MKIFKSNRGFTLLEVIIVIIIIGVLASLALPRFFRTVEYSRATEALTNLSSIRQAMQRCFLQANTFVGCNLDSVADVNTLDVDDPDTANSHFTYAVVGADPNWTITATRNSYEAQAADIGATITITDAGIKAGTGPYSSIR